MKAASPVALSNARWARKIDSANALKGGSSARPSGPIKRVKTCKCLPGAACPHVEVVEYGPTKNAIATMRRTGFEFNPDRYDPVTHLKLPTAFVALCPRCGMFNCVCGRAALIDARMREILAGAKEAQTDESDTRESDGATMLATDGVQSSDH